MITIITAMYPEAAPFIEHLNMKKDMSFNKFQLFYTDNFRVLITGTGMLKAAIAVTAYLSAYPPNASDFFVNTGVCAAALPSSLLKGRDVTQVKPGDIFMCDKITCSDTSISYYPDLLYRSDFNYAALNTVSRVVTSDTLPASDNADTFMLYDMEAAGVYQALSTWICIHRIAFIKIVSDLIEPACADNSGTGSHDRVCVTPDIVHGLVSRHVAAILKYISGFISTEASETTLFSDSRMNIIDSISENLFLSVTMKHQFMQYLIYAKTMLDRLNGNSDIFFDEYLNRICIDIQSTPCRNKKEGKIYFEHIRSEFFRILFTYLH